ncbi:hypothetical protein L3X38_002402 [Prunus dulcis]|uniref:Uncharacterized protein n=1 Tax=Prunus dulcis TaxID=3755 RepID=A0AAD4WTY1_PRUDU|nr:hypothetical protein L3X38_002402 [Prunus dulcis]
MAWVGEWGFNDRAKWGCSNKKTTLIVCSTNIVVYMFVLYASLYIHFINIVVGLNCGRIATTFEIEVTNEIVERLKTLRPKANFTEAERKVEDREQVFVDTIEREKKPLALVVGSSKTRVLISGSV